MSSTLTQLSALFKNVFGSLSHLVSYSAQMLMRELQLSLILGTFG